MVGCFMFKWGGGVGRGWSCFSEGVSFLSGRGVPHEGAIGFGWGGFKKIVRWTG